MNKVEIMVKAGKGGDGAISFRHEKYVPLGGPDGGDGGRGGNVYVKANRSIHSLSLFRYKRMFKAEAGKNGAGQKKFGRRGGDVEIAVPLGTVVDKVESGENTFLADLCQEGQRILVAKGGRGGLGNVHFATSTNQAPRKATKGEAGEVAQLILDLKLIADAGIIGYPNVGKSTLLAAVSAARPKAAAYPFTTVEPVLGEVRLGDSSFILAEIPGLIEGAHLGKGLGHDFLRHAERTRVLLHLVDGTSPHLIDDIRTLNRELEVYKPAMVQKPQVVAVNKIDLPEVQDRLLEIKDLLKSEGIKAYFISGATGQGVTELIAAIDDMLEKTGEVTVEETEASVKTFRPKPRTGRD